ncbi:MAG TPA: ADP-ribosylglycohydrolase family protein [Thermoanaerobaculaceae bacterium]|nr:ADP-ribosylglycohydrolase family protein [Thermoanaerobaculaceae bacterium]
MLGAIAGDVVGSPYEFEPIKTTEFPLFGPGSAFTDDTVLTCAVAEVLLGGGDYAAAFRRWGRRYPDVSWGGRFRQWLSEDRAGPYGSFGNGSAMRVGPVGWARDTIEEVLAEAERSARPTHDHAEGIKGAQATALAVFLARTGVGKEAIREEIAGRFAYDLGRSVDAVRPSYRFDGTCQRTVPEALLAFFDSTGFEHAVRLAVSLGGDSDTLACIAGSVAEAFYGGVPTAIAEETLARLTAEMLGVLERFDAAFGRLDR